MKRFIDIAIRFFPALFLIALVAIPAANGAWTEDEFDKRPLYAYPLPHGKDNIIGNLITYQIQKGDTLLDVGRWFGVTAKEISNANAGVDWWTPTPGRVIILPDEHILPDTPRVGIVMNIPEMRLYYYYPSPTGPVHMKGKVAPAKFIRDNALSMWFSVPSVVGALTKLRLLQPGDLPSLRFSLFCGEPLPATYAQAWQEAASHSILENLYGPTEATIAISNYRWDSARSPQECLNGIVPIGKVFDEQNARIVDENRQTVASGGIGELCLSGSQVTTGYWNNPEKTCEQFVGMPGDENSRWYRTGDLAKQGQNGCLFYVGRIDHQVKIRGHRVELQEIEEVVRKACGTSQVVSVPWPVRNGSGDGVVAFVSGLESLDHGRILAYCSGILPEYMVPKKFYLLAEMPLNVNGKIDRKKLVQMLEGA